MDGADIWSALGIAPTEDLAAIRSAYARRLKAIDVEADPHAFIALREAYDAARAGMVPIAEGEAQAFADAPEARPAGMVEIEGLLWGEESREAIFAPLAELTRRLVSHARDCDIGQSLAIETWIADAIAGGIPRSNGMLVPAITGFGWEARADDYDCPYAIHVALDRWRDAEYLGRLKDLNPHYRTAWSALTEGAADFEAVHPASMSTLLGIIQHQRPALFEDVDMSAFERWIALLEAQREADRIAAVSADLAPEPVDEAAMRRQKARYAVMTYLMIAGGLAADLAIYIYYVFYRGSILSFVLLGVVGSFAIAVGLERRAQQRRSKWLGKVAGRVPDQR